MKAGFVVALLAGAALAGGCAYPTRSRNLADPKVPATTLARQVCSNCHGVTGNSTSPQFPNLAGQMPAYLVSQLESFRSHDRQDPAGAEFMWGISRNLSDEQIRGLADYFANQDPARQPVEGRAARIEAGRTIFDEGLPAKNVAPCASCHGSDGQGRDVFPRLAGQHLDYLVRQLLVFQRTRQRPESGAMMGVAHDLAKSEIEDVAAYLQALPNR